MSGGEGGGGAECQESSYMTVIVIVNAVMRQSKHVGGREGGGGGAECQESSYMTVIVIVNAVMRQSKHVGVGGGAECQTK